jgi:two-component system response regulator TctD
MSRGGAPPLRVLLAEEDDTLRRLMVAALTGAGHRVQEVRTGTECVGLAQPWRFRGRAVEQPDVIVSDAHLPGWSGLEALHILRAGGVDIPIVLLTAFGSAGLRDRAAAFGAAHVLDKPFDLRELVTVVDELALVTHAARHAPPGGPQSA